jgi:hypothetical protein
MHSVLMGVVVLAACQTAPPNYGAFEDNLAAAGFILKPADTPQRQAMLARLPQHRFLIRQNDNSTHYVYADNLVCVCIYIGTQHAFDQFKANQLQQQLIDEQQLVALSFADAGWSWDAWGPWGTTVTEVGFVYGPVGW